MPKSLIAAAQVMRGDVACELRAIPRWKHAATANTESSLAKAALRFRKIQRALMDLCFALPAFGADGILGDETGTAVAQFKTNRAIFANDPIVGPNTIVLLDAEITAFDAGHGPPPPLPPAPLHLLTFWINAFVPDPSMTPFVFSAPGASGIGTEIARLIRVEETVAVGIALSDKAPEPRAERRHCLC
jgi:hypothetical protein